MAKVFNGGEFLKQKSVRLILSNGVEATITELSDDCMALIDDLAKPENSGISKVRETLAVIMGKEKDALAGIGIVELRGAIDFLSENLFK